MLTHRICSGLLHYFYFFTRQALLFKIIFFFFVRLMPNFVYMKLNKAEEVLPAVKVP